MLGCVAIFSSSLRHLSGYLVAHEVFGYYHCVEQNRSFITTVMTSYYTDNLSVAKGLKLPNLILSLLLLLKRNIGYKTFFSPVIFKILGDSRNASSSRQP